MCPGRLECAQAGERAYATERPGREFQPYIDQSGPPRPAQLRKITSSRLNIRTQSASAAAAYRQDEPKINAR